MTDSILRSYSNISTTTFVPFAEPPAWSPLSLPSLLLWLDASDLTHLWQNSAGSTPVASSSDPVGKWDDKSGSGNHFTQATSGLRPLYQTASGRHYVVSDGIDDIMEFAAAILPTGGPPFTISIAFEAASGTAGSVQGRLFSQYVLAAGGRVVYSTNTDCAAGSFSDGRLAITWNGVGNGACGGFINEINIGTATRAVVTLVTPSLGVSASTVYRDGAVHDTFSAATQVPNVTCELFDDTAISTPLAQKIYQLVITGGAVTGGDLTNLETFMAGKIA